MNLDARTTVCLASHAGIVAIKEASGNLGQIMQILQDRPEGFAVLSGDDALTFPMMTLGGDGVISVVANEVPGPMSQLTGLLRAGDLAGARTLHYKILRLMNANFVESNPLSETHRAALTAALAEAGALG